MVFRLKIPIMSAASPIKEALNPYIFNMDNKNALTGSTSNRRRLDFEMSVIANEKMVKTPTQINIPFLRWRTGPGLSVIATADAASEITNPISNLSK